MIRRILSTLVLKYSNCLDGNKSYGIIQRRAKSHNNTNRLEVAIAERCGKMRKGTAQEGGYSAAVSVAFGIAGAWIEPHPLRGIDVDAIDVNHPVQVRTGGAAGGTRVTEDVAALHGGPRLNLQARHV